MTTNLLRRGFGIITDCWYININGQLNVARNPYPIFKPFKNRKIFEFRKVNTIDWIQNVNKPKVKKKKKYKCFTRFVYNG